MDKKHIEAIAIKLGGKPMDHEDEGPEMDGPEAENDAMEAFMEACKNDDKEAGKKALKSLFDMWDNEEDKDEPEEEE